MTKEEFNLLLDLALIVHRMAPPDDQRLLNKRMTEVQYQEETNGLHQRPDSDSRDSQDQSSEAKGT